MYWLVLLFALTSCSSEREPHVTGEYIVRYHDEYFFQETPPKLKEQQPYPWQKGSTAAKAITKEYFRCKGSPQNPPNIIMKDGKEYTRYYDCSGSDRHSLPLRDDKEFIYPILLELLSYVQTQTGKTVVVTSGHRCPSHQAYLDPSPKASNSKHQIGAEVDFYVQGLEDAPQKVVQLISDYYKNDVKEYKTFQHFDKATDVSTPPLLNKEIFIKIYKRHEGRNFDNRHPYPYISIQVRFDRQKDEKVLFSPDHAKKLLRK